MTGRNKRDRFRKQFAANERPWARRIEERKAINGLRQIHRVGCDEAPTATGSTIVITICCVTGSCAEPCAPDATVLGVAPVKVANVRSAYAVVGLGVNGAITKPTRFSAVTWSNGAEPASAVAIAVTKLLTGVICTPFVEKNADQLRNVRN